MKILFLDHPQFTSASFLLWHGLSEVLPPGSVVAYPHIPTHYDADLTVFDDLEWFREMEAQVRSGQLPRGIPPFAPGEGLTGGGQKETRRFGLAKRFPWPEQVPTEASVLQGLANGEFSLAVLANSHRVPTIALARLKEKTRRMPPIIYLDAGERDELNEHWVHVFRPTLAFKQILTPAVLSRGLSVPIGYPLEILPLPLSSILANRSELEINYVPIGALLAEDGPSTKEFDVFHVMGPTWEGRAPVLAAMDALCKEAGLRTRGIATYRDYHATLAHSRMAVTMRGSGRDTMRYWEIPLYETLMVADGTMGCIHPYPFEDGKTAAFFDSVGRLKETVLRYASDEEGRRRVARSGKAHLARYHSTAARAVFFLERARERLGVTDAQTESCIAQFKESLGWDGRDWRGAVEGGSL